MGKFEFKGDSITLTDYSGRKLVLFKRAWKHIIEDRSRAYFKQQFDKVEKTVEQPIQVRESTKEKNVVIYEKLCDDFYITNTVLGRAYINVVANWKTNVIRTVYISRSKRQKGRLIWPPKKQT